MKQKGKLIGVGVGPGDPELLTLKAVRVIKEVKVIAVPGETKETSVAYRIAKEAIPELDEKEILPLSMPMIKDREAIKKEHQKAADIIEARLDQGEDIVFLTLGDPMVYSTLMYVVQLVEKDGYEVQLVNGVPSFCAAAAQLHVPLGEWQEPIHILPASHKTELSLEEDGTYVLMKSGGQMKRVKDQLKQSGREVLAVENCGMENEKLYRSLEEIPDDAGYFSLLIAKQKGI